MELYYGPQLITGDFGPTLFWTAMTTLDQRIPPQDADSSWKGGEYFGIHDINDYTTAYVFSHHGSVENGLNFER